MVCYLKKGDIMKLFGKNIETQFSEQFFDALCDDTVTLGELDELALTEKIMEELSTFDKKTINTWLKSENKTAESLLKERNERGTSLRNYAKKLEYPVGDSFEICQKIAEELEYTEDLADFLRLFLPSHLFILNPRVKEDETRLEQVSNYALILDEIAQVEKNLTEIETCWKTWFTLKNKLLCPNKSVLTKTTITAGEIQKICEKHLKISDETHIFSYNLESIMVELNQTPSFRKVAPLYLFKVLVKHKSRLQKNRDITINLPSLWKYDVYSIEQDNGRNFNTNRSYLALFHDLCNLWAEDSLVDIPLTRWGFYQTSNLLDFDRAITEEFSDLTFPLFDQLLEDSSFSCYRCGGYDAVLLKELGITLEKLLFFQSMPHYQGLLTEISEYLQENASDLVERFLSCSKDQLLALCAEIFQNTPKEKANFTNAQQNLIFCAINVGLQEYVDYFAKEYLAQGFMAIFRGNPPL